MGETIYDDTVPYYSRLKLTLGFAYRATTGYRIPLFSGRVNDRDIEALMQGSKWLQPPTEAKEIAQSASLAPKDPSLVKDCRAALELPDTLSNDNIRTLLTIASFTLREMADNTAPSQAELDVTMSVINGLHHFASQKVSYPTDVEYPSVEN